jgi:hypothetical protein
MFIEKFGDDLKISKESYNIGQQNFASITTNDSRIESLDGIAKDFVYLDSEYDKAGADLNSTNNLYTTTYNKKKNRMRVKGTTNDFSISGITPEIIPIDSNGYNNPLTFTKFDQNQKIILEGSLLYRASTTSSDQFELYYKVLFTSQTNTEGQWILLDGQGTIGYRVNSSFKLMSYVFFQSIDNISAGDYKIFLGIKTKVSADHRMEGIITVVNAFAV